MTLTPEQKAEEVHESSVLLCDKEANAVLLAECQSSRVEWFEIKHDYSGCNWRVNYRIAYREPKP